MTTHFADSEPRSASPAVGDSFYRLGLAGVGACVATQRETRWMVETLLEQSRHLQAALLDNVAQRAIIAETWVENLDLATAEWWKHTEQLSRLQFERFLHQCGFATQDDLHALAQKLDDMNLRVADLSEDAEKTA